MNKPHSILIVDDDYEDVEFFTEALHDIDPNIECISAHDGRDALNLLNNLETYPDFIFLDLNMPCLNGKQCLTKIKASPDLKHIPVIIYSTSKAISDIDETRTLGASYFLTKPSKFEDIKNAVSFIITHGASGLSSRLEKNLLAL